MFLTALSILGLLTASCYFLFAIAVLLLFPSRHKPNTSFAKPVTLLKPVHGIEPKSYENLKSFFNQEYPEYEILFGVSSNDDPIIPVIQQLIREHPHIKSKIITVTYRIGSNEKVNSMAAMLSHAAHPFLIISDSDSRVEPHYLQTVLAPFANQKVGMVTCLYRVKNAYSISQKQEALSINADFIPSVLVATKLGPMRFGLGATMAVSKEALNTIGGFGAIANYLADDYQLGFQIAQKGWEVVLSSYIVDLILPPMTFKNFFLHQLRWVRTYRVCKPVGYFFSILTQWLPFAILFFLAAKKSFWEIIISLIVFTFVFIFRFIAVKIAYFKLLGTLRTPSILQVFIKECLNLLLWVLAFLGNKVEWQGEKYYIHPNGTMKEIS